MVLTRFIDKIHSCLQHKVRVQNGECFLKTILACRNCQRSAEHGLESIGATAAALLTHLRNIHCNLHLLNRNACETSGDRRGGHENVSPQR
ncbi:unnamed protein product, partial [Brenthis ino]